ANATTSMTATTSTAANVDADVGGSI
ncbi:hypothetical protein ACLKA7_007662, partial [Drosophila subpalustris]